jgi:tight adherence protein C
MSESLFLGLPVATMAGALLLAGSFPALLWAMSGRQKEKPSQQFTPSSSDLRVRSLQRGASDRLVGPAVAAMGQRLRRFTPTGLIGSLESRLLLAGRPSSHVERLLAAKVFAGMLALALGLYLAPNFGQPFSLLIMVGMPVGAYVYPDIRLSSIADRRQDTLQLALPQALDQITISVEAGLGFDAALLRYSQSAKGPLADELSRTIQDVRLGATRREAFDLLLIRTNSPDLRQFVLAMTQGERHGLPMAQILRSQARELRTKRRQRAEQRAATIPVKVIFPMILCILPVLFIVILGPAAFRIAENIGG